MSGRLTSIPKPACPLTFSRMSRRGVGWPSKWNSFGLFNETVLGTGRVAALSTSDPYRTRRPLASWITSPFSVEQVFSATPQVCAAAVTSIVCAVAPASRRIFHIPRTLLLPAVSCAPPKLGLPYLGSAGTHSVLILFQSTSSSSATSIGMDVITPCPISSCVSLIVTLSSAPIFSQMLGSNEPAASAVPVSRKPGRYPETSIAPPAALTFKKHLRLRIFAICRLLKRRPRDGSHGGCVDMCRIGRCCRTLRSRYPRPLVSVFLRAELPRTLIVPTGSSRTEALARRSMPAAEDDSMPEKDLQ